MKPLHHKHVYIYSLYEKKTIAPHSCPPYPLLPTSHPSIRCIAFHSTFTIGQCEWLLLLLASQPYSQRICSSSRRRDKQTPVAGHQPAVRSKPVVSETEFRSLYRVFEICTTFCNEMRRPYIIFRCVVVDDALLILLLLLLNPAW